MKKIFSNLIRITISYSKFFLVVIALSSSGSVAKADDGMTYLKCGTKYLKFNGSFLYSNYNVRTKKFMKYFRISTYSENRIYAEGHSLDRNNGTYFGKYSKNDVNCKKINFNQLPKLNDEGKLF